MNGERPLARDQELPGVNAGRREAGVGLPPLLDLLDAAVIGIEDGRVTGLNSAAIELFAVHPQLAIGRPVIEVLRNHRLETLADTGGELEMPAGARTLVARALPGGLTRSGGLVITDMTAERDRDRQHREVLATLAHEFRTPVAGIKSLLDALATDPPSAVRERFVKIASQEAERLVRLTEDLTVSFQTHAERTFPLADSLDRSINLLNRELAERGARLRVSGEGVMVRCDPEKLVQVLVNLLQNAARHGPPGGVVRLAAALAPHEALVKVTVTDDGPELTDYEQLFEPHQRGATTSPGTGMGLAIVRSIVKGWNGAAWARRDAQANAGRGGNEFGFSAPSPEARP